MLVPCKGEKCISTVHQVTGDERVRINNGRQGIGSRTSDEADHKENLFMLFHGGIQFLRKVIRHIGHTRLLLIAPTQAALVFAGFLVILLLSIFAVSFCYISTLVAGVLFPFPLFLFLFKLLDAFF